MLRSVAAQTRLPDEVIVIGEDGEDREVTDGFEQLNIHSISMKRGSTSAKRNLGTAVAGHEATLIGFLDDDIVLEPKAFEAMLEFWEQAPANVGAVSFNLRNQTAFSASWLKSLSIASKLHLYDRRPGAVLRSGIQTRIDPLPVTTYVDWLATTAVVFRRSVLDEFAFDEFFEGYGYLEDLDLTYRVRKKFRLAVVADAGFHNYPSPVGRDRPFLFGKKEVVNRLYFVRKNKDLSTSFCLLALFTKFLMNLSSALWRRETPRFARAAGNVAGLLSVIFKGWKRVPHDVRVRCCGRPL